MYKRTKIAGILFTAIHGTAFIFACKPFYESIMLFSGIGETFKDNFFAGFAALFFFTIITLFALVFPMVPFGFLLSSIGIIKKGKKSVSAKDYEWKRPGTKTFVFFQCAAIPLLLMSVASYASSGLKPPYGIWFFLTLAGVWAGILAVMITGIALIVADLSKNTKDLAKIK
jgi:predicted small integral membrane protein